MKTFEYKGLTEGGRLSRGLIEALDPKEAREKLAHRGILAEQVSVAGSQGYRAASGRRKPFALDARAMVYRELSSLVRAGLPLTQALDILIGSPELGANRAVLAGVRDKIREGGSLALALRECSNRVTAFEEAVVGVGERAGNLDEVLERLASFLEEQQSMRERIGTAMIYPIIVVVLALGIGLAVLGVMVPRIGGVLAESGMELPVLTVLMLGAARVVTFTFFPVLIAGILGAVLVRRRLARDPAWREALDRTWFRLPFLGKTYTALVNLRFARTLSLLLEGGVPLVEGMSLAGRATGSDWVGALVTREAEAVRHGKSLADAVRTIPPLQAALPGWIEAGEASGNLIGMLESAGTRYQLQWDRLVNRFLSLLEPMLVLVIGVFVLLVALSILLPLLTMNEQLQ